MTGPRKTDAGNPADWLDFATADLAVVRLQLQSQTAYWAARGKLAEAFEKTLKAELIRRGWRLEKTHDLQRLADQLASRDPDAAMRIQPQVNELAESYAESRYPGFDLDEEDWPALTRLTDGVASFMDEVRRKSAIPTGRL